jgi:polysaccharide export outer membrane protein
MRFLLLFFAGLLLLSSCVTNKKILYVQKGDVNKKDLPKDSILREYNQIPFAYKIQPNDALYIRFVSLTDEEYDFFKDIQSSGGRNYAVTSELVDPDGNIIFPVVRKVKVAGLTIFQAQDTLQKLADHFLDSPVVKVRLVNFRFTVLGQVSSEGTITSFNNRITVLEALGLAGGLDEMADRSNIKIIRQRSGYTEVGYVNLLDENLMTSPFYFINQNDVLVVPPLRQRPFRKYFSQNFSVIVSSLSILLLIINLSTK